MPTLVTFNGVNYNIPVSGETGWGDQINSFLVAVAANALVSGSSPSNLTIANLTCTNETMSKTTQAVTAGVTITPTSTNIILNALAAITLNTTTAIANGTDGQILILENSNSNNPVTIQDGANTSQNGDVILGNGESIEYKWDATLKWVEQRRSN